MLVNPALNEIKPVTASYIHNGGCSSTTFSYVPVGATYREGGLLKRRYSVYCNSLIFDSELDLYVGVDDISGDKERWYGSTVTSTTVKAAP